MGDRNRVCGLIMSLLSNINCKWLSKLQVHCFNNRPVTSIPVPFDEDDKDRNVWFLDHDYLENMYGMFKKVNGKF